jgi:hypothetical protein
MHEQNKPQKPHNNPYGREIRCPIHKRLIGRYDARHGVTNTTFFCPQCGKEYTFTIAAEKF